MANRLDEETSPYLRQHAGNPVDWYPWGDEAFAAARARDVPVLLSVGYSACHWCHVMAHESFEHQATAERMNQHFVSIKVDREERPDVDAVYMEAVQALTGRGGWPMTVFLTPGAEPFFGGTYFPNRRGRGLPSFTDVLEAIHQAWDQRRTEVLSQATALAQAIRDHARAPDFPPVEPDQAQPEGRALIAGRTPAQLVDAGVAGLVAAHDDRQGGFGSAPKFPQASMLELVLRRWARRGGGEGDELSTVATTTLDAMAAGGIYDHLGGGFARYSVDASWTVPHFEKMLYDQAGLARLYLHAWQLTGHAGWRQVVDETIAYTLDVLAIPEGGLCSAEDADSEGEEGRFYLWRPAEIRSVLGQELAGPAMDFYGITMEGNFEGASILRRPRGADLLRPAEIEQARIRLLEARATRVRPARDDKVLTEWNAMFLATLAEAAAATGRPDWQASAVTMAEFLVSSLCRDDGRWLRSWQGGRARHLAYASDYAWLVEAFTRLGELTGRAGWIEMASQSADGLLGLFWDPDDGGLFTTGDDAERLIVRSKELYDGATPSANSVAAMALLRLGALTGQARYTEAAGAILDFLGPAMAAQPTSLTYALAAADLVDAGMVEIAVVGSRDDLVGAVHGRWLPTAVVAWGEPFPSPLWSDRAPGAAYVCRDYTCQAPAHSVEELLAQLDVGLR